MIRLLGTIVCFILCAPIALAQVQPDPWDPLDDAPSNATLLASPTPQLATHGAHTLSSTDQADWFAVDLEAGRNYQFTTQGESDTFGALFSPDGGEILRDDDDNGNGNNFQIVFEPAQTGRYLLRITQFSLDQSSSYVLAYQQILPSGNDPWDPADNAFSGATLLPTPTEQPQQHGPHQIGSGDASDWFSVFLQAGQTYTFYTEGMADTLGELYQPDGRTLITRKNNTRDGFNVELIISPAADGFYFIRVGLNQEAGPQSYHLVYAATGTVPQPLDAWDPADDAFENATTLDAPQQNPLQHGPHQLGGYDEADWFRFVLEAGTLYEFSSDNPTGRLVGELFEADGETPVIQDDVVGSQEQIAIRFRPDETQRYLLRVTEFSGGEAAYTLTLRTVEEDPGLLPDAWDPADDQRSTATPLEPAQTTAVAHGPHTLSLNDTADWFFMTLNVGVAYEIWSTGNADLKAALFLPEETEPLLSDDDSGPPPSNFSMRIEPAQDGVYALRVEMFNPGAQGEYTLNYRIVNPPGPNQDGWDPQDDTLQGATPLNPPTVLSQRHGPHRLSDNDRQDWFQINLMAGITYQFSSAGTGDPKAALFAPDGVTEVAGDDDNGSGLHFHFAYTPQEPETYLLQVTEAQGGSAVYDLQYQASEDPPQVLALDPIELFSLNAFDGLTVVPGGFEMLPPGEIFIGQTPGGPDEMTDGVGIVLTVSPGEVAAVQLPTVPAATGNLLARVSVRSSGAGASIAFGGFIPFPNQDEDATVLEFLETNILFSQDSGIYQSQYQKLLLLAHQEGSGIAPYLQVAHEGNSDEEITVYFDNLEVFALPPSGLLPASLFDAGLQPAEPTASVETTQLDLLAQPFSPIPGGFEEDEPGSWSVGDIPDPLNQTRDGQGIQLTADPLQVMLLLFDALPSHQKTILLQARIYGENTLADPLTFGALEGNLDASLSVNASRNLSPFEEYGYVQILFTPQSGSFMPIIQLFNGLTFEGQSTLSIDELWIHHLPSEGNIPASLFYP